MRTSASPIANHNGGHLAFGPDGYLYIGMGDGGIRRRSGAPRPESRRAARQDAAHRRQRAGRRCAPATAIPADNPFASAAVAARPEIWAFGLRNPWRYHVRRSARGGTGALVIGDVGQRRGRRSTTSRAAAAAATTAGATAKARTTTSRRGRRPSAADRSDPRIRPRARPDRSPAATSIAARRSARRSAAATSLPTSSPGGSGRSRSPSIRRPARPRLRSREHTPNWAGTRQASARSASTRAASSSSSTTRRHRLKLLADGQPRARPGDFDGDGIADISVFRPADSIWYTLDSAAAGTYTATGWGFLGDVPVPGDYDGDGKMDLAVYRRSTGVWWVFYSGSQTFVAIPWGLPDDVPVPADYDGDRKTDLAVFRPSEGMWYVLPSSANGGSSAYRWAWPAMLQSPATTMAMVWPTRLCIGRASGKFLVHPATSRASPFAFSALPMTSPYQATSTAMARATSQSTARRPACGTCSRRVPALRN